MQTAPLKSLAGVRVLITRSKAENQILAEKLQKLGATTVELPTITIIPPENTEPLDRSIKTLASYNWLVFTSQHGVKFFVDRMAALSEHIERLGQIKVAAVGPGTGAALQNVGRKPDYVPEEFLTERIVYGLGHVEGKRILLPRADIASRVLPERLKERGASVEEVVAYRTIVPQDLSIERLRLILKQGVDVATFTSPSTVRNLSQVTEGSLGDLLRSVKVACIGPVTAEAAMALGVRVDVVASNHTIDDLVEAIANEIRIV
jgi:uroporphyrinogen III methyltransferase/synthase